eukprot:TRINITY_DN11620_c0_g1_i1.p1 TRINITY_DN11620_c0_g1~~TRINITY_DN11620_c0_g1_i1.p1  ORF type:complete len:361 (+),score=69.48 TRINITY_DN11620_c0_g1_i1:42-1085(+)
MSIPSIHLTKEQTQLQTIELIQLLVTLLYPKWQTEEPSTITVSPLKGGITNVLYKAELNDDTVLVRFYGAKTEALIDRHKENHVIKALSTVGLSSPLYGEFHSEAVSGIVYGYFRGGNLSEQGLKEERIMRIVGAHLARFHLTELDEALVPVTEPNPKRDMFKWLDLVPEFERWDNEEKKQLMIELFGSKDWIKNEITEVSESLAQEDSPIVFCHNDLLAGNILIDEDEVHFIDFEYGSYNNRSWDIANHFIELCGEFQHVEDFPTLKERSIFLRSYFSAYYGREPTDEELQTLDTEVLKFTLSSLLYWMTWGIFQCCFSKIDFDFAKFVKMRLRHFMLKKEHCLEM